jgi:CMP-N-acetylneuraminic acid synthetase
MTKKKILAIIPARGGSRGIKNKNIKVLNKKPLLYYTAKESKNSKYLDKIVLSTDSNVIAKIGKKLGIEVPFIRPKELAKNQTPMIPVIKHVLEKLQKIENYVPDIIVILQPTSPLRTSKHIDQAIEIFMKKKTDSLVSVTEIPHTMNPFSAMKLKKKGNLIFFLEYNENNNLRQKKPLFYYRNGAIYIFNRKCFLKNNSLFGKHISSYIMPKSNSLDIDDKFDWFLAECLIKN